MILPNELVQATELTKTKSTRAKEKEILPKKRPRKPRGKSKGNPKGNSKGNSGKAQKD